LDALATQSYPAQSFEIIVANNDPADKQPPGLSLPSNCTIIDVAKKGSYAARNVALNISKGTIIGFTDSDCIPAKEWIQNAVAHFASNPECSRIAGHIKIFYQNGSPTPSELYNTLYAFPQHKYVKKAGTSVTANLFVYRSVFDEIGFFDDRQLSLGDLAWGRKAHRSGKTIHYVPNVTIEHPARNFRELVKKERRVGGGAGLLRKGKTSPANLLFDFLNGFRPRLKEIKFVFRNGKELDFKQKCTVLFMRHYLLNVRTYEQMRVMMGKEPNRA
jgi:cellulose synthase/poly-beta-1,6-N-acetylglucosamine synthase-like glycosyltransferase